MLKSGSSMVPVKCCPLSELGFVSVLKRSSTEGEAGPLVEVRSYVVACWAREYITRSFVRRIVRMSV